MLKGMKQFTMLFEDRIKFRGLSICYGRNVRKDEGDNKLIYHKFTSFSRTKVQNIINVNSVVCAFCKIQ